jgi:hypothetical protein
MRWYKKIYTGKKAKGRRFAILQGIRSGKPAPDSYVVIPAENPKNLLDIIPCRELLAAHYQVLDPLILGIASGKEDAIRLAARILTDFAAGERGFEPENLKHLREKIEE